MYPNPQKKDAFSTPGSQATGGFAQAVGSTLSKNTQQFNPATAGQFNAPPQQSIQWQSIKFPASQATVLPPVKATPVPSTGSTAATRTQNTPITPAYSQQNAVSTLLTAGQYRTPSGAVVNASGQVVTPPSGMTIDTSGAVSSDMLSGNKTMGDLYAKRNSYASAVQNLSDVSQYSPEYVNAYERSKTIEADMLRLKSNLATGAAPGDTQGFAEGYTNRASMGASAEKGYADIALGVQAMLREGNIEAAKALVSGYSPQTLGFGQGLYSPVNGETVAQGGSYTDKQAYDTAFNLQQTYPDMRWQYDPTLPPQVNLQSAQLAASQSESFRRKNISVQTVQLPGGGIGFYDAKNLTISDGTGNIIGMLGSGGVAQFVAPGMGAQLKADAESLGKQQTYADTVERSFNTANENLTAITSFMEANGINQSNIPIINQAQNKVKAQTLDPGAVAAFQAAITGLRSEYAQVLSRGGEVTEGERSKAAALIPDNLSPSQLQQVSKVLNTEGANAIASAKAQVGSIRQRMESYTTPSSSGFSGGGSSGTGGLYDW